MAAAPDWVQAIGSVLAILAAAVAIFFQSRELREQKKELIEQRRELTLQREQLELQRQELANNVEVQERIAATARHQHYLDLQVRLLVQVFDRPELSAVFSGSTSRSDHEAFVRHAYITAWMRLVHSGLAVGHHGPRSVEVELRNAFFSSEIGVNWWRTVEEAWRASASERSESDASAYVQFVDLVERVCRDAEARLDGVPPGED